MSRNRITVARELEKYLDELDDAVADAIEDQRDDRDSEISRLNLSHDNCFKVAAQVMEVLYFDDDVSITRAIEDAAKMTVNASIYATMERNRTLKYLDRDTEDELRDDYDDVNDMTESRSSRSRDRGREDRRDSRREAARSGGGRREPERGSREDRDDRRKRDDDRRRERDEDERRAEERKRKREGGEEARDRKVADAQKNIDENHAEVVTPDIVKANPSAFCVEGKTLPLAPVYWLGSQVPKLKNNEVIVEKAGEEVKWEAHRTDLYLAVRKVNKPTASIRDQALSQAIDARNKFTEQVIARKEEADNAVTEKQPTEVKQVFTSDQILGQYYGTATPMAMIQTCLEKAGLRYLPSHPVILKVEHYPMWVMSKELTEAVENLLNVNTINALIPALVSVSNVANPAQWNYFHDQVTALINQLLKVELEVRPYLTSILTEWNDFAKWLEVHDHGSLVSWFNNNLNAKLRRQFHIYKAGSPLAHSFVNAGDDEHYASVSQTVNLIYIPVDSENFGAASATKLGRVLESVTPKLYKLLANNVDHTVAMNHIVTQSDEFIPVYTRETAITTKVILMGDVNWA